MKTANFKNGSRALAKMSEVARPRSPEKDIRLVIPSLDISLPGSVDGVEISPGSFLCTVLLFHGLSSSSFHLLVTYEGRYFLCQTV